MDEEYFKRITYATPENIKIRRFYNHLQNRPSNYGMENLFSETSSNINQTPVNYGVSYLTGSEVENSRFKQPQNTQLMQEIKKLVMLYAKSFPMMQT